MSDENRVFIRCKTRDQRKRWAQAAQAEKKSLTAWASSILDQAASLPREPDLGPRVILYTKGRHEGQALKLLTQLVRSITKAYSCEVFVVESEESSITDYGVGIPAEARLHYHERLTALETLQ